MISVILPVYNSENFIVETLESLLQQTYKDLEIIIVNDGSTDSSEQIISTYKDERIKYFKQENKGVAAAFNSGLRLAEGDYITFHGSDDISLPNRFERLLEGFYSDAIGFTHSDMLLITENGSPFGYWQSGNMMKDQIYLFFLHVGTPFNNGTILFRKQAVENVFYDEEIKVGSDTDYVLKVAKEWPSFHIPEPLYLYRRHGNNVTNKNTYEQLAKHIKKNITDDDLKNLKEIPWNSEDDNRNFLIAKLITAIGLSNRWLMEEAYQLFYEAIPFIKNKWERDFYEGMKGLIEKDPSRTVKIFSQMTDRNHIVENYLGEALLSQKKYNEAYIHFIKAIGMAPDYQAPIQNLKAIGILKGNNLIDKYVNKFK